MNFKKINKIIPYIIASILSVSIFYVVNDEILNKIRLFSNNTNMTLFVMSIAFFCTIYLICFLILQKSNNKIIINNIIIPKIISNLIISLFILIFLFITRLIFLNSKQMLGYMSINPISKELTIIIVILINILVFIFYKYLIKNKIKIDNKIFWTVLAITTAGIVACFFYYPNGLLYNYNYDAYYNSIYIHQQGTPYSENFTSVYGHYSLFLKPIFQIIGLNVYTLAIVTSLIGFISILGVIYVIYSSIKSTFIRILGLLTLLFPFAGFIPFPYPQTYPHRLFFPSIIMVLGTYLIKNLNKKNVLFIGYIISSLAIIWNSDTGIVCLLAWGSLHVFLTLFEGSLNIKNLLKLIIPFCLVILSFYCSWGITNLYNMMMGGKSLSLYYYLFPLLENKYMSDIIQTKIPLYINYWIPTLLLFYIFLGQGIASICIKRNKYNYKNTLGFLISILGIGQLMYFMNRCAYFNLLLCYYPSILLILLLSEKMMYAFLKSKKNILDILKTTIFIFCIIILNTLSIILLINIKTKISYIKVYTNMSTLNDMTSYIKNTIPKDTPIVSVNTAVFGISLNWKNDFGFIDLPDLFLNSNKEHIINTLVDYNKPFLIEKSYFNYFKGIPGVFYLPVCEKFRNISDIYDIKELSEMNNIWNEYYDESYDQSTLLYLTPKKY